jgi:hypothetical protein
MIGLGTIGMMEERTAQVCARGGQGYLDLDEQGRIYKVCGPGVTATERRCSGYTGELEFTGGLSMENDRCTDPNPECAPANRWW